MDLQVLHLRRGGAVEPVLVDLANANELQLGEHLVHQLALPPWTKASAR